MKVIIGLLAGILLGLFVGSKTIIAMGDPTRDPVVRPSAFDNANVRNNGQVISAPSGVSDE